MTRRPLFCYPHRRRWFPSYMAIVFLGFIYMCYKLEGQRVMTLSNEVPPGAMMGRVEGQEDGSETGLAESFEDWKAGFINLLKEKPPSYLPEYQNPCWFEELKSPPFYPYMDAPEHEAAMLSRYKSGITQTLRCLPYLYIAGFPRCGTLGLYKSIQVHPTIMAGVRGANYWTEKHAQGDPIRRYVDEFDEVAAKIEKATNISDEFPINNKIIMDGTPDTVWNHHNWKMLEGNEGTSGPLHSNAQYIHHVTPEARTILLMREPGDRLYSDYAWNGGTSPQDFHDKTVAAVKEMEDCLQMEGLWACVNNDSLIQAMGKDCPLHRSMYFPFVDKWYEEFPTSQVLCLRFEDYIKDSHVAMTEIFSFLGLESLPHDVVENLHDVVWRNRMENHHLPRLKFMLPETRELLDKFFEPLNKKLTDMLGNGRFLWEDTKAMRKYLTEPPQ